MNWDKPSYVKPHQKRQRRSTFRHKEDQKSIAKWAKTELGEADPGEALASAEAGIARLRDRTAGGVKPADAVAIKNAMADVLVDLFIAAEGLKVDVLSAVDWRMISHREGSKAGLDA